MEMLRELLLRFLFEYNSAKRLDHTVKTSHPAPAADNFADPGSPGAVARVRAFHLRVAGQ